MKLINYREQYAKYNRYFQDITKLYNTKPAVRASVELLLTLLTVSFFTIFAIRPTANTISRLLAEIRNQEQISATLDQKLASLQEANKVWTAETTRINLLNESLPESPKPEGLVRQIEGLAGNYGINLETLSVGETVLFGKQEEKKNSFEITLAATDSYDRLISFLQGVNSLRRIVNIKSMNMTANREGNLDLTVSAEGYHQP